MPRCSGVAATKQAMVRPSPGSHPDGHAEHSQAQRLAAVLGHPGVGVGGVVHWGKDGWGRGRRQRSVGTTTLQVELPSGRPAQHSIALRKPCPAGRTCGDDVQLHGRELAIHQVLAGGVQVELQRLDCRGRIGGRTGRQGGKQGGRVRGWKVWLERFVPNKLACHGARWHRNTATLHRDGMALAGALCVAHRAPGAQSCRQQSRRRWRARCHQPPTEEEGRREACVMTPTISRKAWHNAG